LKGSGQPTSPSKSRDRFSLQVAIFPVRSPCAPRGDTCRLNARSLTPRSIPLYQFAPGTAAPLDVELYGGAFKNTFSQFIPFRELYCSISTAVTKDRQLSNSKPKRRNCVDCTRREGTGSLRKLTTSHLIDVYKRINQQYYLVRPRSRHVCQLCARCMPAVCQLYASCTLDVASCMSAVCQMYASCMPAVCQLFVQLCANCAGRTAVCPRSRHAGCTSLDRAHLASPA
jgi:hypothetical protein